MTDEHLTGYHLSLAWLFGHLVTVMAIEESKWSADRKKEGIGKHREAINNGISFLETAIRGHYFLVDSKKGFTVSEANNEAMEALDAVLGYGKLARMRHDDREGFVLKLRAYIEGLKLLEQGKTIPSSISGEMRALYNTLNRTQLSKHDEEMERGPHYNMGKKMTLAFSGGRI